LKNFINFLNDFRLLPGQSALEVKSHFNRSWEEIYCPNSSSTGQRLYLRERVYSCPAPRARYDNCAETNCWR